MKQQPNSSKTKRSEFGESQSDLELVATDDPEVIEYRVREVPDSVTPFKLFT